MVQQDTTKKNQYHNNYKLLHTTKDGILMHWKTNKTKFNLFKIMVIKSNAIEQKILGLTYWTVDLVKEQHY